MTHSLVTRDRTIPVTDQEKATAIRVLTQSLRGVDDSNHKSWKSFLNRMLGMEDGEIAEITTRIPRSGPFHRYHMAMEQAVYNAQERFTIFEQFRNWLKIGAGHVTWVPGAKGGVVPLPNSISYAQLEEGPMREVHAAMLDFLRGPHAAPYLWKHLDELEAARMIEAVLKDFDK
ncbi:MAG TPA: DUF1367 family protein [Burkholderiaceae bacterium]